MPSPSLRSRALAAFPRYYPGFFGAAFLVLLRIAIGWHLTYEGLYKIMSTPEAQSSVLARFLPKTEGPPFSSEGYNRAAIGPLANNFRSIVDDVDSRNALDFAKVKDRWGSDLERIALHYGFDDAQRKAALDELATRTSTAETWFLDPENHQKIRKYFDDLDHLEKAEARPGKMTFEVERLEVARKGLEADRKALAAPVVGWSKALDDAWKGLATPDQVKERKPYEPPLTDVKMADMATMIGLTLCGLGLMLGLFTPIAGLGASTFLMLFYLSQPPFPGLTAPPNVEGHYLFVNKNLIEFLACLALAATPSGLWFGIDAFLFGWIDRVRYRRALRREEREGSAVVVVSKDLSKPSRVAPNR